MSGGGNNARMMMMEDGSWRRGGSGLIYYPGDPRQPSLNQDLSTSTNRWVNGIENNPI
jgi:hypothetical protein